MKHIHKTCAIVIQHNKILIVRKAGKDIWTGLGGRVEDGETEEACLLREVKEELDCNSNILKKAGDFHDIAVFDPDSMLTLSTFLVELKGQPKLSDPELEEFRFIGKDYANEKIKLSSLFEREIIPFCIKEGLLNWS